jgi:P-type Ca2+ transporter type 2C
MGLLEKGGNSSDAFSMKLKDLMSIVNCYRTRTFDEDIQKI